MACRRFVGGGTGGWLWWWWPATSSLGHVAAISFWPCARRTGQGGVSGYCSHTKHDEWMFHCGVVHSTETKFNRSSYLKFTKMDDCEAILMEGG